MRWYGVVLGGGSGSRMKADRNKVLLEVVGESMLCRSVRALQPFCEGIVVVIREADKAAAEAQLKAAGLLCYVSFAEGGATRQESVKHGLEALPEACTHVAIHDGARCLVDAATIRRTMEGAEQHGAAVAAVACVNTIKQADEASFAVRTPDRATLRVIQTPQCFRKELLLQAHHKAEADGFLGTDDASLVEHLGEKVLLTEGSRRNIKLTTPEDMIVAEQWLKTAEPIYRVGQGYDVHQLVEGRKLILCGVEIPHTLGLLGHSDADVALHALMDAMLGAVALGDIGKHFPDTDERYHGISSMLLLEHVTALLKEQQASVVNADVTIVAQKPKLLPYIQTMRENIAGELQIPLSRVNVKATTTEHLGFEGEQKGISAQAVVMVRQG